MDESVKSKIYQSVESLQDELVKVVSDTVKIQSVSPEFGIKLDAYGDGESKVNRYMQKVMEDAGLSTDLFAALDGRHNLVGVYKGQGGGKSLLFNGHVDVVPPGDSEWKDGDPFSGKVENGYIYGRGSVDMKGGNAAAVFALKALLKTGFKPKGDVIIQHVAGEECKATEVGTGACLDKGYLADAAIVMEPTCSATPFEINTASSGIFEMKWTVKGKSVHAGLRREVVRDGGAGAEVGVDAIEKGMIIYRALKELERQWGQSKKHPMYKIGNFCINAATIKAGQGPSFVPDSMEMSYSIWYPPQDTPEQIVKEVEEQVAAYSRTDPWLRDNPPEITWIFNWPSFDVSVDEDFCKAVQKSVKSVRPEGGELTGMFAVCDASFIYERNIPVVVLGAGETKYTHGTEEKISIEQLKDAVKMYALAIANWCGI